MPNCLNLVRQWKLIACGAGEEGEENFVIVAANIHNKSTL